MLNSLNFDEFKKMKQSSKTNIINNPKKVNQKHFQLNIKKAQNSNNNKLIYFRLFRNETLLNNIMVNTLKELENIKIYQKE